MPVVPAQFSAHIECVIMNKNMTTDLHEYYDDTNNRGVVVQLDQGLELDAWYDYNTNEFIAYSYRRSTHASLLSCFCS
jgi:hypothetical protein